MAFSRRLQPNSSPNSITAERRAQIEQLMRNDPELQRLFAQKGAGIGLGLGLDKFKEPVYARLKALGVLDLLDRDKDALTTGGVRDKRTFWDNYGPLILGMAGVAGGAFAAGAFGGGAAAGTAASTATPTLAGVSTALPAASALPGTAATLGAAPAVAGGAVTGAGTSGTVIGTGVGGAPTIGGVAGGTPPLVAPAGAGIPGGFWTKAAISLGVDAFKTYMSNRASGKANEALQKGNQQAIDLYGKALSPYMNLGSQSANALGGLMGFNMGGGGGAPSAGMPTGQPSTGRTMPAGATPVGQAIPRPQMVDPQGMGLPALTRNAQAQQQSRSSFVPMIAPDGEQGQVPFDRVAEAEAAGARRA